MRLKTLTSVLCLSALGLSPVPAALFSSVTGIDAAYADKGKGGGKGGGKSHKASKAAKPQLKAKKANIDPLLPTKGSIASELKGLNAYHASETAFENAAPNSRVGRLATYRDAALAAQGAQATVDGAQADLDVANQTLSDAQQALDDAVASGATPEEIADLQDALDQATMEADAAQAAYDDAAAVAEGADLAEEDALLAASDGRVLSRGTLEYLREQLGLDDSSDPAL